jgi:hypothetical protein
LGQVPIPWSEVFRGSDSTCPLSGLGHFLIPSYSLIQISNFTFSPSPQKLGGFYTKKPHDRIERRGEYHLMGRRYINFTPRARRVTPNAKINVKL